MKFFSAPSFYLPDHPTTRAIVLEAVEGMHTDLCAHIERCAEGLRSSKSVNAQMVPGLAAYADADFEELQKLVTSLHEVRVKLKEIASANAQAERMEGEPDE